jgi:DNA-binding IscR family transcriptional regulator
MERHAKRFLALREQDGTTSVSEFAAAINVPAEALKKVIYRLRNESKG